MLGLPLLVGLLSTAGLGFSLSERTMNLMLGMFLAMYDFGAWSAFRHHHRWAPIILALVGNIFLAGMAFMLVPHVLGWAALIVFVTAWFLDQRYLKHVHSLSTAKH